MTEAPGHPDDEPWGIGFGALLAQGANVDPTGGLDLLGGTPLQLGHAYQLVVHAASSADIALDAEWQLEGAPAGVTVHNTATLTIDANGSGSALLATLGHTLVSLTATGGDATTSFAVAGSGQRPLPASTDLPFAYWWSSSAHTYSVFGTNVTIDNHDATAGSTISPSGSGGTIADEGLYEVEFGILMHSSSGAAIAANSVFLSIGQSFAVNENVAGAGVNTKLGVLGTNYASLRCRSVFWVQGLAQFAFRIEANTNAFNLVQDNADAHARKMTSFHPAGL